MIRAAAKDWVLVVDDEEDARFPLAAMLRRAGFEVVEAAHGAEAFEHILVSEVLPLLVVLDLDMPTMSGWELLGLLRSYTRFADLEVLVASGHEPPAEVLRHGARASYLRKPCDPTLVLARAQAAQRARVG